ncbi:MAG: oligosaccharide flippase family protein [Candidatus Saccharicenans sp.]|jgi:O-antigen/teichoic acid export membrane protein|nr:oligosaccharide flippase family protein [Candidatus Saccharicenans sp.]MDH7575627.1 oligosaccharide flippase family protein [Candidatus Saccharicenans sp.]
MASNKFIIRSNIKNLIIKLKQSSFLKNIFIVMSGTAIAQFITYALSPIISRLFTPEDFGIFGSFSAVTGIIGALLTLDYSQASMLPKENHDAINLFCLSIITTVIITFIASAISIIKPSIFYNLTRTRGLGYLLLFFITLLIAGINQASQAWAVRSKAFNRTSTSQIIRSIGSSGSRILLGFMKTGSFGLIISNAFANLLASINLFQILIPDLKSMRSNINLRMMKSLAKEYLDFPLFSASQNFLNAISSGLPVLLITKYYGLHAAGAYAFGLTILQAPMSLVLTALRQVLFQKACEFQHKGQKILLLYIRTVIVLFVIAFIPSIILFIWAPQVFTIIFGAQWQLAGILARSLIIWMLFVFCNLPAIIFSRIIRIQRFVFFYDLVLLAARTFTLIIGGIHFKLTQTVMVFAIVGALMNIYLIYFVGKQVAKKENMKYSLILIDLLN